MTTDKTSLSLYFFDIDDNILFLDTPIYVWNSETEAEVSISTGEFARVHPLLGQPGKGWEDFSTFNGTFREFRDIPQDQLKPGQEQYFVRDIKAAIARDENLWQAPSWQTFVHACKEQRPVSFITARGHSPETVKAGIEVLLDAGLIDQTPKYHSVYPVGNDDIRVNELNDPKLQKTTPRLKKNAIIKSVDMALQQFGDDRDLNFGMSDDDPANVALIITAMRDCKLRYKDNRFFVVNTHYVEATGVDQRVKLEVFEYDHAVTGN